MQKTSGDAPVPPHAVLSRLLFGKQLTASLAALARLGVADHMQSDFTPVEDLAAKVGAHAPSLYRVMRMLAAMGVFRQGPERTFALTPVGELLKSDAPGSMRYTAMMLGDEWTLRAYEHMVDCIRTGGDGITKAFGKHVFDLLAERPEQSETFQRAMTGGSAIAAGAVVGAYDFSGIKRLGDVGGGHGLLLAAILERNPEMQGVLFDLPEVVVGVPKERIAACNGRLTVESGSFFERVPEGCDAFIMKHIIHDWSDEHGRTILGHMRNALPSHGRVLLCELVVTDEPGPTPAKLLDIEMLVITVGGKERTEQEFSDLFASAGFRLNRIVPTGRPLCVIEAVPA